MAAPRKLLRSLVLLRKSLPNEGIRKHCRCFGSKAEAASNVQLHSAVCLQRYPVIGADMNELEQKVQDMFDRIELRKSYHSDYELEEFKEQKYQEALSKISEKEKKKIDDKGLLTLQEIQDLRLKELESFQLGSKITEADQAGDQTTHNQQLDQKLVLLVKQKLDDGKESSWVFPQSVRLPDEAMREAAERTLMSNCGEDISAMFVGNAPCGFYKYTQDENEVVKVFFFKANHRQGEVIRSDNIVDHKWVQISDLKNYLSENYLDSVSQFLYC